MTNTSNRKATSLRRRFILSIASAVLAFAGAPAFAQTVTNTATVTPPSGVTCTDSATNPTCVRTAIDSDTVVASQLTLTKTASAASFIVGTPASYTLSVQNTGTAATTTTSTITDAIPTGLTIGTLPAGCTVAGQTVTCTVATGLAINAISSFVIPVTPTAAAA
ncbi:MAG TPA: hypothetical protein VET30_03880, partial [Pseudoxanthomonas sp.]|nr:hypothetical protein [Pseudoxanthomonas sp.]